MMMMMLMLMLMLLLNDDDDDDAAGADADDDLRLIVSDHWDLYLAMNTASELVAFDAPPYTVSRSKSALLQNLA